MQETKAELTLDHFGNDPITRVENALSGLREGNGVVVLDDESRENEADLIYSSDHLTEKQMALMIVNAPASSASAFVTQPANA